MKKERKEELPNLIFVQKSFVAGVLDATKFAVFVSVALAATGRRALETLSAQPRRPVFGTNMESVYIYTVF